MSKISQKLGIYFLIALILIGVGFGGGFDLGKINGRQEGAHLFCPSKEIDFSLFWEAYHELQDKFVNWKEKSDPKKIVYGAISGMTKSLGDPYTVFFTPKETKMFEEDVRGMFGGVGMKIGIRDEQLQVITPLEGTPAQKAGLRTGDKIIKVDDTYTRDITIEEAVRLIRGKEGTIVKLTISRKGWKAPKEFEIKRAMIEVPSLKWEIKKDNIGYLKIYEFSEQAGIDFQDEANKILNSPAKKIILDLRNNPGGFLEVAQDIAGWFLERGAVVTIEDPGQGKNKKKYRANGPARLLKYPLVVLINQGSASAAEILAGALRDDRGVKIIGQTSFGKGSIQRASSLSGGSSLKITIANWLTPNGTLVTDKGLEPDIPVKMTEEDYNQGKDPQLEKAIEVIKSLK